MVATTLFTRTLGIFFFSSSCFVDKLSICKRENVCYGRPLLQAWLLPVLNTIPNNCVRENFLQLSCYGIGFSSRRPRLKSCSDLIFPPCIYSFVSLLRTLFVICVSQLANIIAVLIYG